MQAYLLTYVNISVIKSYYLGKKLPNGHRPLLVQLENEIIKTRILSQAYLLKSSETYQGIVIYFCKFDYSQFTIPNYMLFAKFYPNSSDLGSSGIQGIIIFVSDKLQVSSVSFLDIDSLEYLCLRLKLWGNDSTYWMCLSFSLF